MEVCFDPQTFLRQRAGGISRLFTDLIVQFDADPSLGVQVTLPFRWSNNTHLTDEARGRGLRRPPPWVPRELLYGAYLLGGARGRLRGDLVHHTYYSGSFLAPYGERVQVTTVYDMIPELFAGTPDATGSHLRKRDYVAACDLVICISDATRRDMEEVYGSLARRVVTIPLSVGPGFGPGKRPLPGFPSDYLLYVGKRAGYKDFGVLPAALQALQAEGVHVPLVIVGSPLTSSERHTIDSRGLRDSVVTVSLDDMSLARAYANATALVQTSRYEGFGLTPLEAMASGIPVVIANASAMPEVGGDVATYFTPGDPDDLARAIGTLLGDETIRREAGRRGVLRAANYTPHHMARRTAEAYRATLADTAIE